MKNIYLIIFSLFFISFVFCRENEKYIFIRGSLSEGTEHKYKIEDKISFNVPGIGYIQYGSFFNSAWVIAGAARSNNRIGKRGKPAISNVNLRVDAFTPRLIGCGHTAAYAVNKSRSFFVMVISISSHPGTCLRHRSEPFWRCLLSLYSIIWMRI